MTINLINNNNLINIQLLAITQVCEHLMTYNVLMQWQEKILLEVNI